MRNPTTLARHYRAAWLFSAVLALGSAFLAGCQSKPEAPEPEAEPATETAAAQKIDPVVLHELLDRADEAIANDHLTYPIEASAFAIYRQILALEPDQEDAMRGLEHIVELYIVLAMSALERNQFATARSMLSRARIIDPEHPSIEPTDEQIRLLS